MKNKANNLAVGVFIRAKIGSMRFTVPVQRAAVRAALRKLDEHGRVFYTPKGQNVGF